VLLSNSGDKRPAPLKRRPIASISTISSCWVRRIRPPIQSFFAIPGFIRLSTTYPLLQRALLFRLHPLNWLDRVTDIGLSHARLAIESSWVEPEERSQVYSPQQSLSTPPNHNFGTLHENFSMLINKLVSPHWENYPQRFLFFCLFFDLSLWITCW